MSDQERPEPQYGEYASNEEQAIAMKRYGLPSHDAKVVPSKSEVTGVASTTQSAKTDTPPTHSIPANTRVAGTVAARALDRVATVFLLSFGFVYVIGGISTYLNFADSLQSMLRQMGMAEYHSTNQTVGIGIGILVSQAVIWVIAAAWSFRRMIRGKRTWWIPLLAGALTFLVSSVLIGVLLAADPALVASFQKL